MTYDEAIAAVEEKLGLSRYSSNLLSEAFLAGDGEVVKVRSDIGLDFLLLNSKISKDRGQMEASERVILILKPKGKLDKIVAIQNLFDDPFNVSKEEAALFEIEYGTKYVKKFIKSC